MSDLPTTLSEERARWLLYYLKRRQETLAEMLGLAATELDLEDCAAIIDEMEAVDAFLAPYQRCECGVPHAEKFEAMRAMLRARAESSN